MVYCRRSRPPLGRKVGHTPNGISTVPSNNNHQEKKCLVSCYGNSRICFSALNYLLIFSNLMFLFEVSFPLHSGQTKFKQCSRHF